MVGFGFYYSDVQLIGNTEDMSLHIRPIVKNDINTKRNSKSEPNVIIRKFTLQKNKCQKNKCYDLKDKTISTMAAKSQVCELHFTPDEILKETSMVDRETGKTITAPLLVPRLKLGAIPSFVPKYPVNVLSKSFPREVPVSRRKMEENDNLTQTIQVLNEGGKTTDSNETRPSSFSVSPTKQSVNIKKSESSHSTVEKKEQHDTQNIRTISNAKCLTNLKNVSEFLTKDSKLGMKGNKLVIFKTISGKQQVIRDLGPAILVKHSSPVVNKMKLTSENEIQSDVSIKQVNTDSPKKEKQVVKQLGLSNKEVVSKVVEDQKMVMKAAKLISLNTPQTFITSPINSKQPKTETSFTNGLKGSCISHQLKVETSTNDTKGHIILPFGNLNQSNRTVIDGKHMKLPASVQNEGKMQTNSGNLVKPMLVKCISNDVSTSTQAETSISNSALKQTVVLTSALKAGQPILKVGDIAGNSVNGKTIMLTSKQNQADKNNGKVKYVALPGHILPKLLPGTKVFTAGFAQNSMTKTHLLTSTANTKEGTVAPAAAAGTIKVPTSTPSVPKILPLTAVSTSTNKIELKVEVDQKGDIVGVTPTGQQLTEQMDSQKAKFTVQKSLALLQKRCNQAMELRKKVLQKETWLYRERKVPQRTVVEVDKGTQTSFFSLVEPGRLVEIQLEEDNPNGEISKENSIEDSPVEKVVSVEKVLPTEEVRRTGKRAVLSEDIVETPESKKFKTSKPPTVYDVLIQHNVQKMHQRIAANYSGQKISKHGISRTLAPAQPHSCSSTENGNLDFTAFLESPAYNKLKTPEMQLQLYEDYVQCIQRDNYGNIPLHVAVLYENLPLVKRHCALLVARKAPLDVHNDDMETPLHLAVLLRNVEIIKTLIKFGARVLVVDSNGNTALHLAALQGNEQVMKELLTSVTGDLPLNKLNDEGLAPLHLCAQAGKLNETKALIDKEAEVDLRDAKSGRTPLFHAVERNAVDLVKLLLDMGANPNLQNFSGQTAFMAANEFCESPTSVPSELLVMPKLMPFSTEERSSSGTLLNITAVEDSPMSLENDEVFQPFSKIQER